MKILPVTRTCFLERLLEKEAIGDDLYSEMRTCSSKSCGSIKYLAVSSDS
jgi:hypothetical protein